MDLDRLLRAGACAAAVAFLVSGCASAPQEQAGEGSTTRAPLPARLGTSVDALDPFEGLTAAMAGVWRSNGYGYVADLSGAEPVFYHMAGDYCRRFTEYDSSPFDVVDRASVSDDGARLIIGASPEPHTYEFRRLTDLPEECAAQSAAAEYATVFEAFVSFMATHYAFFDVYGAEWEARTAEARARLGDVSSDGALFDLLSGMLVGIDDGHLSLIAEIDGERRDYDPGEAAPYLAAINAGKAQGQSVRDAKRAFDRAIWGDGIGEDLLAGKGVSAGNGWIQYGLVAPDVGYVATFTSGGFAARDFSDPLGDLAILETALDEALDLFSAANARAVILDASMNHGGHDFISRAMAARFAAAPVSAYSKFAADADDPYRTDIMITPAEGRRFTGPVYLLTSNITVSAAEILTLSMRALPNVTHVGAATRGAFSDILEKPLPNGWLLTVSNEVYADAAGAVWEGRGAPPEIVLTVFTPEDPAGAHSAAVRRLVDMAHKGD
ncbi:MAG: S41 family peptidase [Parvularculaceae bacterium]|nr:S41 family peptidase [Parvularculaceae bacterium]